MSPEAQGRVLGAILYAGLVLAAGGLWRWYHALRARRLRDPARRFRGTGWNWRR